MEEEKLYWMALAQFENTIGSHPLTKDLKSFFDNLSAGLIEGALSREFSLAETHHLLTFLDTVESQSLINKFLLNREQASNTKLYSLIEKAQYIRANINIIKKKNQKSQEHNIK